MSVKLPAVWSTTIANALPANATETVICILPGFSPPLDYQTIFLAFTAGVTIGTGTTGLIFQLKRGATTSGTRITAQTWTFTVTPGNSYFFSGCYPDTPGAVGGQQYCLTVIQSGATAAGTLYDVALLAFVL